MTTNPFIFAGQDGRKSFDFSPWGGIEGFLEASKRGQTGDAANLKRLVSDLAHAVDMTAVAISSLPFEIVDENDKVYDSSENWQNKLSGMENPQRLIYLLASSLCGGDAYLIPTRTKKLIFDLQYCAPASIQPYIDYEGLRWFDRSTEQGKTERLYPNQIIYFWLPDSDVEIGPAKNHPLGNASLDAQLVWNMKNTMRMYGERGFVPITLLGAKGMPNEGERTKAEAFFDRLLRNGFNVLAKIFNAEALSIVRLGAGMDELKGSYLELRQDAKESIADAFGIPAAMFMSDKAYASEMDVLTRQWYKASRFVSIYQTIAETMSDQLLKPYGYRMRFNLNALDIFQEDEAKRGESLDKFVSAVTKDPEVAQIGMQILGYDLDAKQQAELKKLIADKEADRELAAKQAQPQDEPVDKEENQPKEVKSFKAHDTSAMIALRIPDLIKAEIRSKYSFADEEILKDLHITLVYLGDNRTIDKLDVVRAVSDLGMFQSPIKGRLQGLARFVSGGETDPIVMTFDSPQAPKLYNMLCGLLDNYHVPYHKDYGFIPHMTLAYIPRDGELPIETIEPIEINFSEVYYVDGAVWYPVDLVGYENKTMKQSAGVILAADEIKDLALWYDRAKQWHAKGKGAAVDWECKHLREEIAAPIRLKLAEAKSESDIVVAFQVGDTAIPSLVARSDNGSSDETIIALADALNNAAAAVKAQEVPQQPIVVVNNQKQPKKRVAFAKAFTEGAFATGVNHEQPRTDQ